MILAFVCFLDSDNLLYFFCLKYHLMKIFFFKSCKDQIEVEEFGFIDEEDEHAEEQVKTWNNNEKIKADF